MKWSLAGKKVSLIGAESSKEKLWEALGRAPGYGELFLEDYSQASVQGVGILYWEPPDDLIERTNNPTGIKTRN